MGDLKAGLMDGVRYDDCVSENAMTWIIRPAQRGAPERMAGSSAPVPKALGSVMPAR